MIVKIKSSPLFEECQIKSNLLQFIYIHCLCCVILLPGMAIHELFVSESYGLLMIINFHDLTVMKEPGGYIFSCTEQNLIFSTGYSLKVNVETFL